MGKRILIPGLIALLLVAGVSAWLVLNPPGQGKGSGAIGCESGAPIQGVSGDTPDATAKAHGQDGHATSVHPGSQAGSKGDGSGDSGGKTAQPSGTGSQSSPPGGASTDKGSSTSGGHSTDKSSGESAGKPAHSKIIDAPRPPNQTLGNARPVSRAIMTKPFKKLEEVSEKLKQDRRGLYAQYYAFTGDPLAELSKPEAKTLAQRDAALVRIDNQVYFPNNEAFSDLPFSLENFAAMWDGYFVVPEQGEYWLFLGADNAARVDLDGETVLLNDVQSRYIEVSTVLELAPGLHPIHIEFEQGMLANDDSWRCAASFMWVPKGAQKPIAVPPEMLMVPDWMWSDDAPIITKLSKNEGEIGDEIMIEGSGFFASGLIDSENVKNAEANLTVLFNGQSSRISGVGSSRDRQFIGVLVPIGASSGRLNMIRTLTRGTSPDNGIRVSIPSNSVDFKVTTQFGLMAQWYDLGTQTQTEFVEPGTREPDVVRMEPSIQFDEGSDFNVSFQDKPIALHLEGRLGIPAASRPVETSDASEPLRYLRLYVNGHARVRLNGVEKVHHPVSNGYTDEGWIDFPLPWGEEQYQSLSIDFLSVPEISQLLVFMSMYLFYEGREGASSAHYWTDKLARPCVFFPPVQPPKPPRIASVIPMTIAGDEPPTPPFAATPGLVSVREGQQFKCNVEIFGDEDVRAAPVTLSVDGHVIECGTGTLMDDSANKRWFRQFVCVLPPGCGEGMLTAKLGLSTSEPFYIDVANKGLIAYLYDLPNPGGYSQFPNILPLTLHTIRKDSDINFDTADSFKLPFVAETFAVEWYGAIVIDTDGWYTFTSRTDDGCRVWLNGIEIIDDDNLHAPQEKSSERIKLAPGIYPFRMQFFECNQHEECLLFVAATDLQEKELLAKQVVPKRMFTWEVHDMLPDKIATGKKADGSD